MKIAILSDLHLGFGWGTEREEDSFIQAKEALQKATKANLIIIAGDIFDSRNPKQEILQKTLNLFSKLKFSSQEDEATLVDILKDSASVHEATRLGVPIVAIFGTHERRGKGLTNPVKLLEEAGYLIQLDGGTAIFELGNEQVAITGISGVPEVYVKNRLKEVDPKPVSGMPNILILHQSITDFVHDSEKASLGIADLPKGFDLIVNGHIHSPERKRIGNMELLLTGSTITTQAKKKETEIPKRIFFYNTKTKEFAEAELSSPRKVFYIELECSGMGALEIKQAVLDRLNELAQKEFSKKPIVRVRIKGEIEEQNMNFMDIADQYKEGFILTIQDDTLSKEQKQKLKTIQNMLDKQVSIDELGIRILQENAEQQGISFNVVDVFELLSSGQIEALEEKLIEKVKIVEEPQDAGKREFTAVSKGQQTLF